MARGRFISKSLSTSERFDALNEVAGKLAEFCQALYPLIIAHTDDYGRMQGDAKTVKLQVFPISPRKVPEFQAGLDALDHVGLITLYTVPGGDPSRIYLQVNKFDGHQTGLHKRTAPRIPEPPPNSRKLRAIPGQGKGILRDDKRIGSEDQIVPEIDPTDTWQRVIAALDVSDATKLTFFAPCVLIRETDELIEIAAPGKTAADFLRSQYSKVLRETMQVVCPGKGLSIVVQKAKAS